MFSKLIRQAWLPFLLLALLFSCYAWSGSLTLTRVDDINFGAFSPNEGGVLVLDPNGAINRVFGNLLPMGGEQPGMMFIEGEPSILVRIHLPSSVQLIHKDNNALTIDVGAFKVGQGSRGDVFPKAPGIRLDPAGEGEFSIGATLYVNANQPPGIYEGNLQVNITRH